MLVVLGLIENKIWRLSTGTKKSDMVMCLGAVSDKDVQVFLQTNKVVQYCKCLDIESCKSGTEK